MASEKRSVPVDVKDLTLGVIIFDRERKEVNTKGIVGQTAQKSISRLFELANFFRRDAGHGWKRRRTPL